MEDFEYSVEISDRDWDCFFQECEECSMLSPALAGLDDSGMSDMDDTASILANRVKRVDLTAGLSEADRPVDGPPDCEGSPVEHFLSKHGVGGMESVLSGSEEDIHLQSVNIFFERLKSLTEAEKLPEPNKVKAGENREAIQEEELCSDGKQASSSISPKNIPKLNSPPARGETAGGKETTEPVDAMSNINTMKKVQPGSKISHELAASNSVLKTNISAPPQIELFIQEEDCTETRANKETLQNQSHDSPNGIVCTETSPQADKVVKVKTCTPFKDVKQKDLPSKFDTESFFSPLITAEEKDELVPIFSYSRSTNKNLQFPEAYDYFFTSSSTDDSSLESDEEDDESGSPVKVVTRFTRSTVQKQTSSPLSLVPVRQSAKSLRGTIRPLNALGHQDMTFPDPLLYHLEDRISRQLAQQPFRYEDLQIAVSNPRLDASFLPLRQSDMCLVCIAFASWVLKTANPQVGDAWKAVLLANVSALSAIRYLRKYVKVEAAASERELQETASSDS
eukprot:superscaffoldBa00000691_g6599